MDAETITAYVGIGSNLGDRAGNLLMAVRGLLEANLCVQKLSAIYETEPHGVDHPQKFLNMAAEIQVAGISPAQMMTRMLRIEYLLGRKDKFLQRPRTVDLDLLIFGDVRLETDLLTLPHPFLHERRFVLVPLAEIAPQAVHPVFQKTVSELLEATADRSEVHRWNPNAGVLPEGSGTEKLLTSIA